MTTISRAPPKTPGPTLENAREKSALETAGPLTSSPSEADDALYAPINPGFEDLGATFTGSVSTFGNHIPLATAAAQARARSSGQPLLPSGEAIANGVKDTNGVIADPATLLTRSAVVLGMAKKAADGIAESGAVKRLADGLGNAKTLGDKGNARAGIVTNSIASASNAITAVRTGDVTSGVKAGTDAMYAAGSTYDTLSQRNPAIAQHWVVGSRYFAAASLVSVGRAAVDTTISAGKAIANPNAATGQQLANDAGRLSASTGAAAFTVSGAKNATAGAIAKKTGEEFAVVAAKVLPKALDTTLNVALKRAPLLFAAADVARAARVSTDGKSHPMKTALAWAAVGGSAIATVGMLTANPVLVAAGGVVSLAAGTVSDVID